LDDDSESHNQTTSYRASASNKETSSSSKGKGSGQNKRRDKGRRGRDSDYYSQDDGSDAEDDDYESSEDSSEEEEEGFEIDHAAEIELRDATIKLVRLLANISIDSGIGMAIGSKADNVEVSQAWFMYINRLSLTTLFHDLRS
jgi:hypothetical protein